MRPTSLLHLLPMWAAGVGLDPAMGQAPFSLDTTFRTLIVEQNVNAVLPLASGELFLSGRIKFPGDTFTRGSARLLPNGQRDFSFPTFPLTTGGGKVVPWNDRFYVGNGLARKMTPDGLIDISFIDMSSGPYFGYLESGDYHIYPDGRVLMSGTHTLYDTVRGFTGNYDLIWFSNTGYLDTTKIHRRGNGALYDLKELPNGQFICSGNITEWEGKQVDRIFRVNADGTPDTTFRSGMYIGSVGAFLPLADGRAYACGNFQRTQAPQDTLRLARFLLDGSLDPTFTPPHFTDGAYDWPYGAYVNSIHPWSNGKVIALGQFQCVNGELRKGICMLDSTGQVEPEFDQCGVDSISFFGLPYATLGSMVVDTANNHIYVCGAYVGYDDGMVNDTQQRFVSRLYGDLTTTVAQPASIAVPLIQVYPNPANSWVTINYALPASTANAQLIVRDVSGRIMEQHTVKGDVGENRSYTLDVSGYAPGFYHLHLVVDGQWITGGKLVVE